ESNTDLTVGFAYTCKGYSVGREATLQCPQDLVATHAVGTESIGGDQFQYLLIGVGLDGIVYVKRLAGSLFSDGVECLAQQRHIVEVKRCLERFELRCGKVSFDHLCYSLFGFIVGTGRMLPEETPLFG